MAKQTFTTGQVLLASQLTSLQQTAMLGGAASNKTSSYTLVAADAGTGISMTSTSATTITVNTGLFAAGDKVQITNLGTGVSTITAGTATVNTSASLALAQYESGTLDFTSTSAAIFIKGAGAAAASGGMTLISTTTLSGTSVTLSSIPSTYKHLLVTFSNIQTNSNYYFAVKPNNASNCDYQSWDMGNSTGTVSSYTGSAFSFNTNTAVNSSDFQCAGSLWIYDYASATLRKNLSSSFGYRSPSSGRAAVNVGLINTTSAISSLVFDAGGNTFSAGTLLLYGVS